MSKIFVINVNENVTRWKRISNEMRKQNISCHRFPAIKPTWSTLQDYMSELSPSFLKCLLESHPSYTLGAIGCFLSHRYLWNRCAESNQIFGIFEDDISFTTEHFRKKTKTIMEGTPDFDLLCFFPNLPSRFISIDESIQKPCQPLFTAYAYMIHPSFARKMIPRLSKIHAPFDIQVKFLLDPLSKVYFTNQKWIHTEIQRNRESSVQHIPQKYIFLKPNEKPTILSLRRKLRHLSLQRLFEYLPCGEFIIMDGNDVVYLHFCHDIRNTCTLTLRCSEDQLAWLFHT